MIVIVVALAHSAPAGAVGGRTYCVYSPASCPASGVKESTVASAVAASEALGSSNTILVGPGVHADKWAGGSASTVSIMGEGEHATILTGGQDVLGNGSSVSDLTIAIGEKASYGLMLRGSADHVAVTGSGGAVGTIGVYANIPTSLEAMDVEIGNSGGIGVSVHDNEGVPALERTTIEDSSIHAGDVGVEDEMPTGDQLDLERDVLDARSPFQYRAVRDTARIEDSLLYIEGGNGVEGLGEGRIAIDHDTIASNGSSEHGITATSRTAVSVADTIIDPMSVPDSIEASESQPGETSVSISDSDYEAATEVGPSLITPAGTSGNIDVSPLFLSGVEEHAAQPFALQSTSKLIDAGSPEGLAEGEQSTTDLAGEPRVLIGNGSCGPPRTDIGAYEFSAKTIPITTSVGTGAVAGGTAAALSGSACDPDPVQTPTFTWTFDDGTSATGPSVSHVFATAGRHSATLSVSDAAGRSAAAAVSIPVAAAPPASVSLIAPPIEPPPAPVPVLGTISFPKRTLTVSKSARLSVPLFCPVLNTAAACTGKLTLTESVVHFTGHGAHRKHTHTTVTIATAPFTIPSGQITSITLHLAAAAFKTLVASHQARVSASAASTPGPVSSAAAILLKAPATPRHH